MLTDFGACLCRDIQALTWSLLVGTAGFFLQRPSFDVLVILECGASQGGSHSLALSFPLDWPLQAQVVAHHEQYQGPGRPTGWLLFATSGDCGPGRWGLGSSEIPELGSNHWALILCHQRVVTETEATLYFYLFFPTDIPTLSLWPWFLPLPSHGSLCSALSI